MKTEFCQFLQIFKLGDEELPYFARQFSILIVDEKGYKIGALLYMLLEILGVLGGRSLGFDHLWKLDL
jgi:hypothetical protein